MSATSSLEAVTPALSMYVFNFSATDPGPGGWQATLDQARAADAAGVDRLFVSDHVVFGENLEAYGRPEVGGIKGGKQPTDPDGHWLEPLTLLSVLAGITTHSRLLTGILIAALRRPVVLAKTAATLDVLSGGRLDLGVGVGWQREEYEAAGLPFEGRGRLLNHSLDVCQTLWREKRASFSSEQLNFEAIHCMPKPLQPGGVPIWVSGTLNKNVLARIVRFGSGWIPWGPDAKDPAASLVRVREALSAAGRDPAGFQVTGALPVAKDASGAIDLGQTMDRVPALVEAGITDFTAGLPVPKDPSKATDYLSEVVTAFRKVVGR
jgi:probable F420-dependent oxidoreductase